MKKNLYLLFLLNFIIIIPSLAQHSWQWVHQAPINARIEVIGQETDSLGRTYVNYNMGLGNPGGGAVDSVTINGTVYRRSVSQFLFAGFSRNGQFRWAKQFSSVGSKSFHVLNLSSIDRQGNIFITGHFADTLQAGPHTLVSPRAAPGSNAFPLSAAVIKLDSLGNVLWAKQSTGSNENNGTAFGTSSSDQQGNLYVVGSGNGGGNGCYDGFCFSSPGSRTIKYNPQGQVIAAFPFGYDNLKIGQDNSLYFSGSFNDTITIGGATLAAGHATRKNIFLVKYGPAGNVLWVKQEGNPNSDETIHASTIDRDGNLYLIGEFLNADANIGGNTLTKGTATAQTFIAKYSPGGQLLWVHKPNYLGTAYARLVNLVVDDWGNIFVTGQFPGTGNILEVNGTTYTGGTNGEFFMLAYTPSGIVRWVDQGRRWNVKTVNNFEYFKSLSTDHAGGVYFSGAAGISSISPTQLGNLPTFHTGGTFRAKLLDCDAVQATVVSPLTGSLTICNGAPPVQLQAKVTSGGELTYQWQRNNLNITGATATTYSTLQTGDYRVIVSNFNGCIDTSAAVTLSIVSQPLPTATVTAPTVTEVCLGGSVQLQANTGTGYTYQWKRGNDFVSGATSATFAATQSGNYSVVVTNQFGCSQVSAPVSITVNEPPTALISASGPTAICQNQSVTLVAPPGQGIQYQWQLNGTDITGATGIAYAAGQAGDFTVRMTNAKGCSMVSNIIPVTINPAPGVVINVSGSTTICQNGAVTISTPNVNGQTYQWQRNGIDLPGQTTTAFMATQPGDYRVLVTGNANLCSNYSQVTTVSIDPGPIAQITAAGPTAICTGGTVALVANSGTGYTYRWYKDNTLITTATTSLLNVTAPGDYRVEIENSRGCFNASAPVTVTTAPLPTATISTSDPLTFCNGSSANLASTTGTGWLYQWQRNGLDISGATSANFAATQSGDYRVIITIPAGCIATSNQLSANVISIAKPAINAASDSTICAGSSVSLFTTATGSYQWLLNGSAISTATNASLMANQAGNYQVIVTNATGCTDTSRVLPVTVTSLPVANITTTSPLTFCAGGSALLSATTGTNWLYQWQQNGANINGATAAIYNATQSGNYQVVISTPTGCTVSSSALTVTAISNQKPPILNSSDTIICANSSVNLFTTATGTYQWLYNGTLLATAVNASIPANLPGTYQVVVTNATGCADTSRVMNVAIDSVQTVSITANGPLTFCAGDSIKLSTSANSNYTYQWFQNGMLLTGKTADSLWATQAGNYSVQVSNARGCLSQATPVTVNLNAMPTATITQSGYTLFASAGTMYQWYFNGNPVNGATAQVYVADSTGSYTVTVSHNGCTATSAAVNILISGTSEDLALSQLQVYPNPATKIFHLKLANNYRGDVHLQLFDLTGRLIQKQELRKTETQLQSSLNVVTLPSGLYLLRVQQGDKAVMQKLTIKR